jgi:hypothetical protein
MHGPHARGEAFNHVGPKVIARSYSPLSQAFPGPSLRDTAQFRAAWFKQLQHLTRAQTVTSRPLIVSQVEKPVTGA